jgi:hypothetical protein
MMQANLTLGCAGIENKIVSALILTAYGQLRPFSNLNQFLVGGGSNKAFDS